ncbi:class I SAM-dependent methyltransferase [Aliivibrio sp. S4TY2]|uniref:class I SAM-dependent methyltransferase n=1 Tax=unclassified Aliivibrio TaxID=2645654 RepID=UPI002378F122|nr:MULTISPECIES: class I SAM-dependent methyltransferase [unclassified Aliivibrio]MDD9155981.1 class I SAM-dependent methyltransferase [Aliivibrio sp. S4TY2]MDD9159690.1 class I SAM-dependent methyltransferase [Aliivibrio sp. S4TY1]MDD9163690.1 class I SAM-dependent methyltransferase [Aliivibrio sp. S4MY2]MDD9167690.1 class I SAM-dependent methyltransferase [Aliivibrio sp. S4MY4]MDD9185646.1 class I SAM-dependent methyltransferase [Aliivibrio sp. S4MY3]
MNEVDLVKHYEKVFSDKYGRHYQMQEIFPELLKDSKVLDYGCGWGGVSSLFVTKYGASVDAVDLCQDSLDLASKVNYHANINYVHLKNFKFPSLEYDLIFSSQVIEHVHNPGTYLNNINKMLKDEGKLVIGLPNGCNFNLFLEQFFMSKERIIKRSQQKINNYNKGMDHINSWDIQHFITLCASCGFKVVDFIPTEGTPLFNQFRKIPLIGNYIYRLKWLKTRMSYTMFFLLEKEKQVDIGFND